MMSCSRGILRGSVGRTSIGRRIEVRRRVLERASGARHQLLESIRPEDCAARQFQALKGGVETDRIQLVTGKRWPTKRRMGRVKVWRSEGPAVRLGYWDCSYTLRTAFATGARFGQSGYLVLSSAVRMRPASSTEVP